MIDLDDVWDFMHEACKILTFANLLSLPVLAMSIINGDTGLSLFSNWFGFWILCLVIVYMVYSTWLCR